MKILNADFKRTGNVLKLDLSVVAPTLGWKDFKLNKVLYFMPPIDGIQDVFLTAKAPNGPAPTAIEIFDVSINIDNAEWFEGVRVIYGDETMIVLRNTTYKKKEIGQDWFVLESIGLRKDKLFINLRYGGGCQFHKFQLNWDGEILKRNHPLIILDLSHNSNGDPCKGIVEEKLQFDLSVVNLPTESIDITIKGKTNEKTLNSIIID